MFNTLLSIFVCAAASLFLAWVVSAHVSAPYIIAGSTHAFSVVTLEDFAVHGECCPPGRDSSLNIFVFVFVSGAISLSQVDVAFNVLDLSVVDIYWRVVFRYHLYLRFVHLHSLIFTFSI